MRLGSTGAETIGSRAVMVLAVTFAAHGCTDRGVQVVGQSDGEDGTTTADATTEQDTNSDGRGTDDDSGGADSTTGPSDTTATSGADDSTGADDESSGSTGAPDDVCEDGRVEAPCGPATQPCSVVADELIAETPRTEYWAPAIAASVDCDPQVHYTTLGAPMNGHLASRDDDGTWSSEPTPFAWIRQLERDPDGQSSVAIGGEDNPDLWAWDDGWVLQAAAPGDSPWWATGAGTNGAMYLAARDMDVLQLHTWVPEMPGTFTTMVLDEGPTSSLGLGGGTTGTVAWWSGSADGWTLRSSDGSGPPQVIDTAFPGTAIAVADGGEHLLYTASTGLGAPTEVRYAERLPSGVWSIDILIADDPDGVTCGPTMPTSSGDTCDYDYTRVRVHDIVTSDDGDVRVLFTEDHFVGQAVASTDCPGPGASPIPLPFWWCPEGSITTRLFVGWPDGAGGVAFESVSEDHRVRSLDADLDAGGGINIAALVNDEDDNVGTSVRYMRLR